MKRIDPQKGPKIDTKERFEKKKKKQKHKKVSQNHCKHSMKWPWTAF